MSYDGENKDRKDDLTRYRSLVEEGRDVIFALTPDGTFCFLNEAVLEATGWPRERWLGKPFLSLLIPDEIALGMTLLNQALSGRKPPAVELRVLSRSGDPVSLEVLLTPIPGGKHGVREVTGVARDVRMRKFGGMSGASPNFASVDRLASGIAHHYNNLLTIQRCYLSFLLEDLGRENPELVDSVQEVVRAAERATHLTRELLLFSRKKAFNMSPMDLGNLVRQMASGMRRALGDNVELQIEGPQRIPPVMADRELIEEVIFNLIANAKDAMPEGGRVVIRVDPASFKTAEEKVVCLSISDTGCGVPLEILDQVFDPFFTTKEIGKGTGLGLTSAHAIIRRHRGWIDVQTENGKGTTFQIFLPVAVVSDVSPHETDDEKRSHSAAVD